MTSLFESNNKRVRFTLSRQSFPIDVKNSRIGERSCRNIDGSRFCSIVFPARRLTGDDKSSNAKIGICRTKGNFRYPDHGTVKHGKLGPVFGAPNQAGGSLESGCTILVMNGLRIAENQIVDAQSAYATTEWSGFRLDILAMADHSHRVAHAVDPHSGG